MQTTSFFFMILFLRCVYDTSHRYRPCHCLFMTIFLVLDEFA
uniref:Uncharacterized protein n=1 Tax=Setaria viridis TaxID=4556 RepID=A0A4V6DE51_SETVI|nr:hypothetical protein SEVIR_2G132750v2 [Setaria viridis]